MPSPLDELLDQLETINIDVSQDDIVTLKKIRGVLGDKKAQIEKARQAGFNTEQIEQTIKEIENRINQILRTYS